LLAFAIVLILNAVADRVIKKLLVESRDASVGQEVDDKGIGLVVNKELEVSVVHAASFVDRI
jgi:hypothetical protein